MIKPVAFKKKLWQFQRIHPEQIIIFRNGTEKRKSFCWQADFPRQFELSIMCPINKQVFWMFCNVDN